MVENKTVHEEVATPAAPPQPVHTATNGLAVASMVVGIVAFVSGWAPFWGIVAGIAAVVLGILGLRKPAGKGMSIAGIVTGGIAALTSLLFTTLFLIGIVASGAIVNKAEHQAREQAQQSENMINAKKDFAQGETATFGTLEVKINSVQHNYTPSDTYSQPASGKEYMVLNITVKNISNDHESVGPYSFTVDNAGNTIDSSFVSVDPELNSNDLLPGKSVTGNVVFEVPQGATNLKLQYEATAFDSNYQAKTLVYTLAI